jgi:hypothetical protein
VVLVVLVVDQETHLQVQVYQVKVMAAVHH